MEYKHILLATDLSDSGTTATKAAIDFTKQHNAELSVVLVVPVPSRFMLGLKSYEDIEAELIAQAEPALQKYAKDNNLPDSAQLLVKVGSPKEQIVKASQNINADLLVIGSHGEHGVSDHIGSTINAVLQKITSSVFIAYPKS